jgi:hypothetical protein
MDILNFISWIKGKRQVTSVDPTRTLLPVGLKDGRRDDDYLAGAITVQDFIFQVGAGTVGPQGPIGPQGVPGPVGPAGLTWQGAWVSGTSYSLDDAVGYNGASWFCILATSGTTNPATDTTHWALLANQGATGPQGPQGIQGPAGGGFTHRIGEFYQGGYIFYQWLDTSNVEHGLVITGDNLSTAAAWSNVTSTAVGTTDFYNGVANTNAIIAQPGHTNSAAKLCADHAGGGYTDWYLPSAYELAQLYVNIYVVQMAIIAGGGTALNTVTFNQYWNSTEQSATDGYLSSVATISNGNANKANARGVRAIRKY